MAHAQTSPKTLTIQVVFNAGLVLRFYGTAVVRLCAS
jgi:hypothetical protein